jgi:phosphoglycerate dehydrogenase-like enzyme
MTKVLISDYEARFMPDHGPEIETLKAGLGVETEVQILPYTDESRAEFYEALRDADALLTAFIPMDEEAFEHAPKLKIIALDMTGYDTVDLKAATRHHVGVAPVGEYCTWDVSESAIGMMFALNKYFKYYQRKIDKDHEWDPHTVPVLPRLQDQTLGICGFGKIGKCTARKARNLVHDIVACDPLARASAADELGVRLVSFEELCKTSDIIVNHMNLNETNRGLFDSSAFGLMARHPILINMGRGLSVVEDDLVQALDSGQVRAYGCDVLNDETPDLVHCPLVGRDNVIITPHSSFLSRKSLFDLETIPAQNIVKYLTGHVDEVFKLVNRP